MAPGEDGAPTMVGRVFFRLFLRPLGAAHGLFGPRVWRPLEQIAQVVGAAGGVATRRFFAGSRTDHPMMPLVRFTDWIEGSLGIRGVNTLHEDGTATRRVTYCPFAHQLRNETPFCTRLGVIAGQQVFQRLVPGGSFEVLRTMSQGHPCCEYRFFRR